MGKATAEEVLKAIRNILDGEGSASGSPTPAEGQVWVHYGNPFLLIEDGVGEERMLWLYNHSPCLTNLSSSGWDANTQCPGVEFGALSLREYYARVGVDKLPGRRA